MAELKVHKFVSALPGTLEPSALYFVRVGAGFDLYATNESGTVVAYGLNVPDGGGGALTYASVALTEAASLATASVWVDGPAVSLGAGTWLVTCTLSVGVNNSSSGIAAAYVGRITDGTTHYASAVGGHPAGGWHGAALTMSAVVVLTATTAVKGQAYRVTTGGASNLAIKAAGSVSGTDGASHIRAVKIG